MLVSFVSANYGGEGTYVDKFLNFAKDNDHWTAHKSHLVEDIGLVNQNVEQDLLTTSELGTVSTKQKAVRKRGRIYLAESVEDEGSISRCRVWACSVQFIYHGRTRLDDHLCIYAQEFLQYVSLIEQ